MLVRLVPAHTHLTNPIIKTIISKDDLVRKIRTRFPSLPILVGGLALNDRDKPIGFDTNNTTIIRNIVLADAIEIIRLNVT